MGAFLQDLLSGFKHDSLRDDASVAQSLPSATRRLTVDGVRGWLYPVVTEGGDVYQLFLWFDGSSYQVKVVAPDVEGHDPHTCHLFPQGRLCLGADETGGETTLEGAYARSVLWAHGFSQYRRTGRFPF